MKIFSKMLLVCLFVFVTHKGYSQSHFTGKFSAAQEVNTVTENGTGTASCILTDEGLWFYVTVEGLSGNIAAAHFHNAALGVDGPVVRTITDDFDGNTATGLWTSSDSEPLTAELIKELKAGNLYLNVHTSAHLGGEIRAQLNPSSGTGLNAILTPEQENHDVTSNGIGTASLNLTDEGVAFKLTIDGLNDPLSAAHFHRGALGMDGPVVRTITNDFVGNTAFGLWTPDDDEALTDSLIADLIAGNLYFNVHTASYPMGEIRGQIELSDGWGFSATLDTTQENHPVTNNATGTASLTLTNAGLNFNITVEGLSGPITLAHFHSAPAGQDGGVVRTITDDFDGNTASGLWTPNDDEPLTTDLIKELLGGNLYLNVHTSANPTGEIRGQVLLSEGSNLGANLTAEQQTDTVSSPGTGTATFTMTDTGLVFNVTIEGLSGPMSAAHFHNNPAGVNGSVVRTITGDFTGNTASGVWKSTDSEQLTDQLVQQLFLGNLYLNVHTSAHPGGEIRGQIYPSAGTNMTASLTSEQDTLDLDAKGSAALNLTDAGLQFFVTVEGLSGPIAAAHFHNAPAGENGGVVRTITDDFDGNTAAGFWTANDGEALTDFLRNELLAGNLYLNVHTSAHTSGEIRGQIFVNGGVGMSSRLDGNQEVPDPVSTDAMGTGALTFTDAGLVFDLSVEGLSGPISLAHFHNAPAGTNGGVVRTITDDFDGNTAFGIWRSSDSEPFTIEMINELLSRNIYFNVHTAANTSGEIRGQIAPSGVITAIKQVNNNGLIPDRFSLSQNYPNPFNPTTTIEFFLMQPSFVTLKVYNILGEEVVTLVSQKLTAGKYKYDWDASSLASGVYLYKIKAGDYVEAKKMVLMR